MVFNRKGNFFLNLDEKAPDQPVSVAPVAAPAPKAPATEPTPKANSKPAAVASAPSTAPTTTAGKVLTTAEAIAAELAATQAARPAATNATFSPDCLVPGTALPMRRRRGGANLAGFRSMAGGLFGKK